MKVNYKHIEEDPTLDEKGKIKWREWANKFNLLINSKVFKAYEKAYEDFLRSKEFKAYLMAENQTFPKYCSYKLQEVKDYYNHFGALKHTFSPDFDIKVFTSLTAASILNENKE